MKKRRITVKLKITLWFTAFMALIAGLCLGLILLISGRVASRETVSRLSQTVQADAGLVEMSQGSLNFDPDFSFYQDGVYISLYNQAGAMLTGQTPPGFPEKEPLKNGVIRSVQGGTEGFYVFDLWIPSSWEEGVWIRGALQAPSAGQNLDQSFLVFFLILPFVILSAAAGGYLIVRKALQPMEQIIQAAESITEGKDLEKRISLSSGDDEVRRLAGSFNRMFERLERSFEAEKQFASDASHELRTPTAVIVAQCAYMKKYADQPEEYQEGVEVIQRQAERMTLLINRLLDMTRLDFGTRKLQKEETDISGLVQALCQEQDTGQRGISLETRIQPGIKGWIDVHLFSRAVVNLLENARKYGREQGHIQVRLDKKDELVLEVEDDGIGISQEHLEKIWQRFYQVSPSRESSGGLGLGLSMVRQVIELHGGRTEAKSSPGEGSCFRIILPEQALLPPGEQENTFS